MLFFWIISSFCCNFQAFLVLRCLLQKISFQKIELTKFMCLSWETKKICVWRLWKLSRILIMFIVPWTLFSLFCTQTTMLIFFVNIFRTLSWFIIEQIVICWSFEWNYLLIYWISSKLSFLFLKISSHKISSRGIFYVNHLSCYHLQWLYRKSAYHYNGIIKFKSGLWWEPTWKSFEIHCCYFCILNTILHCWLRGFEILIWFIEEWLI